MKKLALFFVFLLCSSLYAQKLENSLLWKITGNGLKEASYLFGTNHFLCDPTFNEAETKAIESCKTIVFESGDQPAEDLQPYLTRMIMLDKTLSSLCSPEEFEQIILKLKPTLGNLPAEAIDRLKPWVISLLLETKNDCQVTGSETAIQKIADSKKKSFATLEKVDVLGDFLNLMDKLSISDQMTMLREKLKQDNSQKSKDRTEDINSTANSIYNNTSKFGKEFADILLVKRNNAWLPSIERMITEKSHFIAVGSAHLGGKHGLIPLLRKKGFKVEAVK